MVEGQTDVPVAERLIQRVGLDPVEFMVAEGKARLDRVLRERSLWGNVLVLRDLDNDAECAPTLIGELIPYEIPKGICLRIPVKSVESWLLADVEGFSQAFAVHLKSHEVKPDESDNPKRDLINQCRRSKSSTVREQMTQLSTNGLRPGPAYTLRVMEFAQTVWDPKRAAKRSPSLARALVAIDQLAADGVWS